MSDKKELYWRIMLPELICETINGNDTLPEGLIFGLKLTQSILQHDILPRALELKDRKLIKSLCRLGLLLNPDNTPIDLDKIDTIDLDNFINIKEKKDE